MNGYDLIAKMRKTRRIHPLTATEQALYNELVAMCNDVEWNDVFTCSNYELCNALSISENTLKDSRNRLIQTGLIFYKSGKSKRQFSSYSFSVDLSTTSNFDTKGATNAATNSGTVRPLSTSNSEDYYKQTKLKEVYKESARENWFPKKEDVERFFCGAGGTKEQAEYFFNKYESVEWKLNGSDLKRWHSQVKNFLINWQKEKVNGHAINQTGNKSNPGTSEKRIEALKKWGSSGI